jgi:hypothetical protein
MIKYSFTGTRVGRHLCQPDGSFRSLDLTEEWTHPAELVVSPMLQQTSRFRGDLPLAGIQVTPGIHVPADLVYDRGGVVFLLLGRKPFAFVKDKALL